MADYEDWIPYLKRKASEIYNWRPTPLPPVTQPPVNTLRTTPNAPAKPFKPAAVDLYNTVKSNLEKSNVSKLWTSPAETVAKKVVNSGSEFMGRVGAVTSHPAGKFVGALADAYDPRSTGSEKKTGYEPWWEAGKAVVEGLSDPTAPQTSPSQAIRERSPYTSPDPLSTTLASFGADAVLDPSNALGGGATAKGAMALAGMGGDAAGLASIPMWLWKKQNNIEAFSHGAGSTQDIESMYKSGLQQRVGDDVLQRWFHTIGISPEDMAADRAAGMIPKHKYGWGTSHMPVQASPNIEVLNLLEPVPKEDIEKIVATLHPDKDRNRIDDIWRAWRDQSQYVVPRADQISGRVPYKSVRSEPGSEAHKAVKKLERAITGSANVYGKTGISPEGSPVNHPGMETKAWQAIAHRDTSGGNEEAMAFNPDYALVSTKTEKLASGEPAPYKPLGRYGNETFPKDLHLAQRTPVPAVQAPVTPPPANVPVPSGAVFKDPMGNAYNFTGTPYNQGYNYYKLVAHKNAPPEEVKAAWDALSTAGKNKFKDNWPATFESKVVPHISGPAKAPVQAKAAVQMPSSFLKNMKKAGYTDQEAKTIWEAGGTPTKGPEPELQTHLNDLKGIWESSGVPLPADTDINDFFDAANPGHAGLTPKAAHELVSDYLKWSNPEAAKEVDDLWASKQAGIDALAQIPKPPNAIADVIEDFHANIFGGNYSDAEVAKKFHELDPAEQAAYKKAHPHGLDFLNFSEPVKVQSANPPSSKWDVFDPYQGNVKKTFDTKAEADAYKAARGGEGWEVGEHDTGYPSVNPNHINWTAAHPVNAGAVDTADAIDVFQHPEGKTIATFSTQAEADAYIKNHPNSDMLDTSPHDPAFGTDVKSLPPMPKGWGSVGTSTPGGARATKSDADILAAEFEKGLFGSSDLSPAEALDEYNSFSADIKAAFKKNHPDSYKDLMNFRTHGDIDPNYHGGYDPGDEVDWTKLGTHVEDVQPDTHHNYWESTSAPKTGTQSLHGIEFKPVDKPDFKAGMNFSINAPAFEPVKGKKQAAGVVMVEPDGRVWIIHPKGQFGGYKSTFPKGTVDAGEHMQEAALREVFEESGLTAKITGHLTDVERTTSKTRFYIGERTGGAPWAHGHETEGVSLLNPKDPGFAKQLQDIYGSDTSDHKVLEALKSHLSLQEDLKSGKTVQAPKGFPEPSKAKPYENAPTGYQLKEKNAKLAGVHEKHIYTKNGQDYIFKPTKHPEFVLHNEKAANDIAGLAGLHDPKMTVETVDGKKGTMQEVLGNKLDWKTLRNHDLTKLATGDLMEIIMHHPVDWLTSNHDAHTGQWLQTPHGLVEIDRGQAFKHFGTDKLDPEYHPNAAFGEEPPIYNQIHKLYKEGKLDLNQTDIMKALEASIGKLDKNTLQVYDALNQALDKAGKGNLKSSAHLRFNNLKADMAKFWTK